jgi:large subunit ribosomal protein L22
MNATAKGRYLRISPLKLRKVVKIIRGRKLDDALSILKVLPQKAAKMTYKVLFSARANYKNRFPEAGETALQIDTIMVDQAPILKRMMPRARGRADILHKMSSHLTVIVSGSDEKTAAPAKTKTAAAATETKTAETKKPVKKAAAKTKPAKAEGEKKDSK